MPILNKRLVLYGETTSSKPHSDLVWTTYRHQEAHGILLRVRQNLPHRHCRLSALPANGNVILSWVTIWLALPFKIGPIPFARNKDGHDYGLNRNSVSSKASTDPPALYWRMPSPLTSAISHASTNTQLTFCYREDCRCTKWSPHAPDQLLMALLWPRRQALKGASGPMALVKNSKVFGIACFACLGG